MDSNAESKQLEIGDLEVKRSLQKSLDEQYEEEKANFGNNRELPSRNEDRDLSQENSSICNFKSMEVTHNSTSSVVTVEFENCDENVQYQFCKSPVRRR